MTTQWNKYERTAARKHGKQGRDIRPKSTTVDIHSHVAIPQAGAFVKPHLDMDRIPLFHFASAETRALSQKQEEDIRSRITSYDDRLADLEASLVQQAPLETGRGVPTTKTVSADRAMAAIARVTGVPASSVLGDKELDELDRLHREKEIAARLERIKSQQ